VNTEQIMQIALDMAGLKEIPGDSRIYVPGENIRRVLFGIDIGVAELWVAKQLGYDCVIAHHPPGGAFGFLEVLHWHVDQMVAYGVPREVAEAAYREIAEPWAARQHSANYDHVASFARLLEMPLLNVHAPCDLVGRRIMEEAVFSRLRPDSTVQDVVDALLTLPEFQRAPTRPEVRVGRPENPAGRVVIAHGNGSNGGYPVATAYFDHGVNTVCYLHLDPAHAARLRQEGKGNVVVMGHMAGDMVGINPFLRRLREAGLEVTGVSGAADLGIF